MIIRIMLILSIAVLLAWVLRQRGSIVGEARTKLIAIALFMAAVLAVLFPEITNDIANSVGVGRGADLLLYGLAVTFLASQVIYNRQRNDDQRKLYKLARKLAIIEANQLGRNQELHQEKS